MQRLKFKQLVLDLPSLQIGGPLSQQLQATILSVVSDIGAPKIIAQKETGQQKKIYLQKNKMDRTRQEMKT